MLTSGGRVTCRPIFKSKLGKSQVRPWTATACRCSPKPESTETAVSWNVNSGATNYRIGSEALEYYGGMMTIQPHFPESFGVDIENDLFYINETGYSLQTGEVVSEYRLPEGLPEGCAPTGPVTPDGQLMFTLGYGDLDGKICVLQAGDLQFVQALTVLPETTYNYSLLWPYLSPNGRQLIVPTTDGVIHVYQVMP